ncbi:hypothetical protein [Luteococcus sp. H101]
MTVLGGLLILAALLAIVASVGLLVRGVGAVGENQTPIKAGQATVTLQAGEKRTIWSRGPVHTICEVEGPEGPVEAADSSVTVSSGNREYQGVASFQAPQDGTYRVSCDDPDFRGFVGKYTGSSTVFGFVGGLLAGILALIAGIFLLTHGLRKKHLSQVS